MDRDDATVLTAEYALGLLAEDEERHVARLLRDDPAMRADLAFWETRLVTLLPLWEVAPPPRVLTRLHAELFGTPETSFLDDILHPSNRKTLIAVGTAKLALIGVVLWVLMGR